MEMISKYITTKVNDLLLRIGKMIQGTRKVKE